MRWRARTHDILLNHSTGFDHELDDKIQDFYDPRRGADKTIARISESR